MDNGGDTPAPSHEPPSLPASPLPKRTKVIEPSANISVAGNQDTSRTATPTPAAAPLTALTHPPKPSTNGTTSVMAEPIAVPSLQVKLLSDKGKAPTRGSAFAAGYDLYSAQDTTVPARGKALVDTGISIAVPAGTYGRVAPRSGLAVKHSITTGAGVIDADYRGPVKVVLFNLGDDNFEIKEGDRIAQLVLERIVTPEVAVVAELEESVRGAGGFGSTGGFGEKNITGVV